MADVKYIITAEAGGAIREFKQVDSSIDRMKGTTERGSRSLKGMWKQMALGAGAIAGVVGALRGAKGLIGSFMSVAIQTEQYEIQLKTLLGSQEKATQAFAFFRDVAASLPYTLEEVIQSGTRLAAINVPFEGWIPRIADLASAIGMDLAQATDQMARAMKGGLGAADLFREKGVSAMIQEFARLEMGINDVSKLSLPKFQEVLWKFTEQFEGASAEMATTWKGITSMLADKWFQFRDAVMKAGVFDILKKTLSDFNKKLDELIESGRFEVWVYETAQTVIRALGFIKKGFKGLVAELYVVKAAWYDLNIAINLVAKDTYEKMIPAISALAIVFPTAKVALAGLIKGYAELLIQTKGFVESNRDATDKAAKWLSAIEDVKKEVQEYLDRLKKTSKETEKFSDALGDMSKPGGAVDKAKKAIDGLQLGHDLWGKAILKTGDLYKALSDKLESHVFKPIKRNLFDLREFWKDVNQQIEAEWIRGISSMITEFKNFNGAIKQFLNTMFQMFADTIGKIVVEWVKGTIAMKEAIAGVGKAVEAFSVFFAVHVMQGLLTGLGILKEQVDAEVQAILNKLEEAKRKGQEVINTIRRGQLAPGEGGEPPWGGVIGDIWNYLNKIPAGLTAMIDSIKKLRLVIGVSSTGQIVGDFNRLSEYTKRLDRVARLATNSFALMMKQGKSFYEALTALQEPLTKLRDKYLEIGKKAPPALRPILDMLDKMEERPGLFKSMSGLLDILSAFNAAGFMTKQTLFDLANSAKGFVKHILGVTGNLRKAIGDIESLTKQQILMLAPVLAPFLDAAQRFGLKLPGWLRDLISKTGIKVEEQPIKQVPPLLKSIDRHMQRQTTRIAGAIHGMRKSVVRAIRGIPSGQHGLDFQSGSRGGLVRYHPNERITVTPNISVQPTSVNMQVQPATIIVKVGQNEILRAIKPLLFEHSRDHGLKIHPRGITSQ